MGIFKGPNGGALKTRSLGAAKNIACCCNKDTFCNGKDPGGLHAPTSIGITLLDLSDVNIDCPSVINNQELLFTQRVPPTDTTWFPNFPFGYNFDCGDGSNCTVNGELSCTTAGWKLTLTVSCTPGDCKVEWDTFSGTGVELPPIYVNQWGYPIEQNVFFDLTTTSKTGSTCVLPDSTLTIHIKPHP